MEVFAVVRPDADHTVLVSNSSRIRRGRRSRWPLTATVLTVLRARFAGDVSMNDCLVLGYTLPK